MTEMTMPEETTKSKQTRWNVIIPVVIIVILCCLCLSVTLVFFYLGTQGKGPLKEIQGIIPVTSKAVVGDWSVFCDWGCTGSYAGPATLTFYDDFQFSVSEDYGSLAGFWSMAGRNVKFIFDEYPNSIYIGELDNTGTYMDGTMSNSDGGSGCWYANRISPR